MSRYAAPIPVPDEARELVAAINAKATAFWDDIRAFNRDEAEKTGKTLDNAIATSNSRDELIEQLRKTYFPRAHRILVDDDAVITVSATARSIRTVWTIEQPHVWDE